MTLTAPRRTDSAPVPPGERGRPARGRRRAWLILVAVLLTAALLAVGLAAAAGGAWT